MYQSDVIPNPGTVYFQLQNIIIKLKKNVKMGASENGQIENYDKWFGENGGKIH